MTAPFKRYHSLRRTSGIREMLSETRLSPRDLMLPIFIREDITAPVAIKSMPGVFQHSVESAVSEIEDAYSLGIRSILLFGIPRHKDPHGTAAWNPQGGVQTVIKTIKSKRPEMVVFADCCLCEYTTHGHCGIMTTRGLDNDATLDCLKKIAFSYANAGADFIAPSGMMDGAVKAIRNSLDDSRHPGVGIMAYSAKYASALYGPFREAAGSSQQFKGDRKGHQLNPTQSREAILETLTDIAEGADIVMVKPGMLYLDIITRLRDIVQQPIAVYQVSGEYSMIKLAGEKRIANDTDLMLESLIAMKRAGADIIITYAAKEVLSFLN